MWMSVCSDINQNILAQQSTHLLTCGRSPYLGNFVH